MKHLLILIIAALLFGCSTKRYMRHYHITELTVVLADADTINQVYRELNKNVPKGFWVDGFYDAWTNTIYVENEDTLTLGHEMWHVINMNYRHEGER
jgi:hypothetical protein